MAIKTICENDEQWNEARKLSGTRASAILGQNPYMTNVDAWEIITHRRKEKDISENEAVMFGLDAEKHIRALYALELGGEYQVFDPDVNGNKVVYAHADKPYLTASIDGLLVRENDSGVQESVGVLEIKTTTILNSIHRETWRDGIPQNYYIQLLHEIMVLNADFGILVAYLRYGDYSVLKAYRIERKDVIDDINALYQKEVEFYEQYVATNTKPALLINVG